MIGSHLPITAKQARFYPSLLCFCLNFLSTHFSTETWLGPRTTQAIHPVRASPFLHWLVGHASCVSNTPCPGGKIFAEPQRRFRRLRTAGTVRAVPARGQKGGHQGFHPFESRFLLGWHGEILRTETIQERQRIFSSVRAAIGRPFPHLYAIPDSLLLHIRFTLRRRG